MQEKLAVKAPELYVPYFNNKLLSAVSLAWLGPYYQMTSQVNSSHPGSAAQDPHCDYHLGFRPDHVVVEYPGEGWSEGAGAKRQFIAYALN